MNVRRRGFTLIEILVTIGIILVLVAIVSVGITYVTRAGKNNSVKVSLNNLRGMIGELEATAGLAGRQPTEIWYDTQSRTGAIDVWKDADPQTAGNQPAYVPVNIAKEAGATPDRYTSDAIANTQRVIQLLLAAPKNKSMFGQFPPEQLLEKVPNTITVNAAKITMDAQRNLNPTLPLDSWGNPIIFVPGTGLCGDDSAAADDSMWIGGEPGFVNPSTTAKQVVDGVPPPSATQVGPIRSPDGRPFWASAGPDGDFRTGDDNVYSFEN